MAPQPVPQSERRRRAATRIAAAALGLVAAVAALDLVWPRLDRSQAPAALGSLADLAKPPTRPVTVLLIGSDAERPADASNGAAPPGPPNSDALLLLRVQPNGPLQVLQLPIEAAVRLPGQQRPQSLGSLYRSGGVALVSDAVRELLSLPPGQPDRYVVIGRAGLRQLIDALGELDLSPPRAMRYVDRRQQLSIALDAGLQRLDGRQVEHLVRFRDPNEAEDGRRQQQQVLLRGLVRELAQPARLTQLAPLARQLLAESQTNLSEGELLSLLVAGLAQPDGIDFGAVPLAPAQGPVAGLRELAADTRVPASWQSAP